MMEQRQSSWLRALEIVLGAVSIIIAIVVVLDHQYTSRTVPSLLVFAVFLNSVRIASAGGIRRLRVLRRSLSLLLGVAAAAVVAIVILLPGLSFATFALLLATGLAIQGLGRLSNATHLGRPRWLRASALTVGLATLALAGIIVAVPRLTTITLVAILALTISVNGIESIIIGIQPSTRKQLTLVKLVVFAIFYGFIEVNWIDLYYNRVPAYHIWLILTYMAPFVVLLVFQGLKDWQLALSLGLLVSLMNDLGYYVSGDLLFRFHVALVPWLSGQLGFQGGKLLFTFQGGIFTIGVTSYLMGASVYARIAVVVVVLYHWWRRPTDFLG